MTGSSSSLSSIEIIISTFGLVMSKLLNHLCLYKAQKLVFYIELKVLNQYYYPYIL